MTYHEPDIFYLSIHRTCFEDDNNNTNNTRGGGGIEKEEWFYPGTGRPTEVGAGTGKGTNLNLVWTRSGMGNEEYAAAFAELVLPVMGEFRPDLILIACGLDAAKGDLLGDCGLSPDMFYIMTKSLLDQAGADIPIVAVLEGGYNIGVSAKCMENVALALLDEPCHNGQYYDLSRYWKHNNNCQCSNKRRAETASRCIRESTLAMEGVEEGAHHVEPIGADPLSVSGNVPFKKRCKLHPENLSAYEYVLM